MANTGYAIYPWLSALQLLLTIGIECLGFYLLFEYIKNKLFRSIIAIAWLNILTFVIGWLLTISLGVEVYL